MIKIRNLTFSYKNEKILKNISFSVSKGDFLVILGPNGSGKSTLLKCVNYLLKNFEGEILIENTDIRRINRKKLAKLMAFLPQETNSNFPFSVFEMIIMGRNPHLNGLKTPSSSDEEKVLNALKTLNIERLKNKRFDTLSGGEKKLVLLARALTQESKILLLDEPTNHLDFKNQYLVLNTVKKITYEKKLTSIVTLHDPNLAYKFADKILIVKNGERYRFGEKETILTGQTLQSVYEIDIREIIAEEEKVYTAMIK
jgi:iron complex transport system ATP-binding protein